MVSKVGMVKCGKWWTHIYIYIYKKSRKTGRKTSRKTKDLQNQAKTMATPCLSTELIEVAYSLLFLEGMF